MQIVSSLRRHGDETKPLVKSTCQLARKPSFWPLSCVAGFEYMQLLVC